MICRDWRSCDDDGWWPDDADAWKGEDAPPPVEWDEAREQVGPEARLSWDGFFGPPAMPSQELRAVQRAISRSHSTALPLPGTLEWVAFINSQC